MTVLRLYTAVTSLAAGYGVVASSSWIYEAGGTVAVLAALLAALLPAALMGLVPVIARLPRLHRGWSTSQRAQAQLTKAEDARSYHWDRAAELREQINAYQRAGRAKDLAYAAMTAANSRRATRQYKAACRAWRAAQPEAAAWQQLREHERLFTKYDEAVEDAREGERARHAAAAALIQIQTRRQRAKAERARAQAMRRARRAVAKAGPPQPRMHSIPVPGVATMPPGTIDT